MVNISGKSERIKTLRKTLGLTQKDFAAAIGLKQTSYSEIENKRSDLTERNKKLICQAFNVNPEWIETGNGEMFLESDDAILEKVAQEYNLDDIGKSIVKLYANLPERERKLVMKFIDSLLEDE